MMKMKKNVSNFVWIGDGSWVCFCACGQDDKAKIAERLNDAAAVIREIMATPDKGIPGSILAWRIVRGGDSEL